MTKSKADALASISLFQGLSRHDLEFLAANVDEVDVPAGRELISEGQTNHSFYVLAEGRVEVLIGGQHRRDMGPGDFFGEISMDARMEATATVRTTSAIHAFVVSHAQFRALEANQTVLLHLRSAIAERLEADRRAQS